MRPDLRPPRPGPISCETRAAPKSPPTSTLGLMSDITLTEHRRTTRRSRASDAPFAAPLSAVCAPRPRPVFRRIRRAEGTRLVTCPSPSSIVSATGT